VAICRVRQLVEPGFRIAMAPSWIDFSGETTRRSGSALRIVPSPEHFGHAPYGELNEKSRGVISVNEVPQSGQA